MEETKQEEISRKTADRHLIKRSKCGIGMFIERCLLGELEWFDLWGVPELEAQIRESYGE